MVRIRQPGRPVPSLTRNTAYSTHGTQPPPLETFTPADILAYGKRRHRRVQFLAEQFWTQWRAQYLLSLTRRHKWKTRQRCATVGDVVLLRDKQKARNAWPMGRIKEIKHSSDGLVRSVDVSLPPRTEGSASRTLTRAISDVVLLIPSTDHPPCGAARW